MPIDAPAAKAAAAGHGAMTSVTCGLPPRAAAPALLGPLRAFSLLGARSGAQLATHSEQFSPRCCACFFLLCRGHPMAT
eukprot:CAMPEP_0176076048 /NCGR_PEP_ID=MMETSP0120_2-20121206/38013_1 /TAXON_ID=160619 /ORGANISM="Kryptoperidinium foliaceum, Strain CCMP 1326" /LENGTH=78 /DNA_ID=CAMNT_0017409759 /DNA_START=77 /DNA_END=309 /DNA_ORIENTATION=+